MNELSFLGCSCHVLALTLPLGWSASDDHVRGLLVAPRPVTERWLAPRGLRIAPCAGAALAPTVRVVEGVHRHAADRGALAPPAALAGFADVLVLVLDIADLADGGVAEHGDAPDFTGWHPDLGVIALARQQLRRHAGGAHHLATASRLELDVMHRAAQRDGGQRERIARLDVRLRPAHHLVTHGQADGRQDVALLAIGVVQERDPRAAVRVVFHRGDGRRDAELVALEIDDPVELAMPTALVTNRDLALGVAPGIGLERDQQALLRLLALGQVVEGADRHEAAAGRGGLVFLQWHGSDTLEHAFDFLALGERDHGLLPVRLKAVGLAPAAFLTADVHGIDGDHLHLEGIGDRQRDLRFGRLGVDAEEVLAGGHRGVALLTDEGTLHHLHRGPHDSHSSTWVIAERVKMRVSAVSTSVGFRLVARMVLTPTRLRVDFSNIRSCSGITNSVRTPAPS